MAGNLGVDVPESQSFRILALSGGGFRGLFTAKVLHLLEERLDAPLHTQFDLIAGTSIGGINALTIAAGIPAARAVDFFLKDGTAVFQKMPLGAFKFLRPRYTNAGLRSVLERVFEGRTMGDLKTKVIIPSINFTKGEPQVLKTPHHVDLTLDAKKSLVDVALSTSAAPAYFPIHRAAYGDMVDGGLIANHPGVFAMVEAKRFLSIREDNIRMLHIGTMSSGKTSPGGSPNFGIVNWFWPIAKPRLIELMLSSQEMATNNVLQILLKDRYYSIDRQLTEDQAKSVGLDVHTEKACTVLRQSAEIAFQSAMGNSALRESFQTRKGSYERPSS